MDNTKGVFEYLANTGWYEGRKIDRGRIVKFLHDEGYFLFENVITFLQEFIDLEIHFNARGIKRETDNVDFLLEKAAGLVVAERIKDKYSPRIGKKLCVIGSASRDYIALMMAEDNSVYGAYDDFLCKIGDSGVGAIEAIIFNYPFEEIS
jgi:hypothetical protein